MSKPQFSPVCLVCTPSFNTLEEAVREAIITDTMYGRIPTEVTIKHTTVHKVSLSPAEIAEVEQVVQQRKQRQKEAALQYLSMMGGEKG